MKRKGKREIFCLLGLHQMGFYVAFCSHFVFPSKHSPLMCEPDSAVSRRKRICRTRRYSASVINVNGPQRACANKEKRRAAKVKESFKLSLPPHHHHHASRAREEALMWLAGRVHTCERRLLMSAAWRLVVFEWLKRT